MTGLDLIDRKIVAQLMRDATIPIARIADRVGLSQTPCWKRIRRLETTGVLIARVALPDPGKLGFALTVIVEIEAADHSVEWRDAFTRFVQAQPEVTELFRMAGTMDYLMKVMAPDMDAYDAFYRRLTDAVPVKNVTAHFAMERLKFTTALPVNTSSR